MYCKNCGNYMDDNAKFCPNCGAENEKEQPQQSQDRWQQPQDNWQQPQQNNWQQQPAQGEVMGQPKPQVNFLDAIKLFFTHYADFSGRARRSEYWWAYLALTIMGYLVTMLAGIADFLVWLPSLWSIAILVPSIAITVRRLHDVGHSGTFYLWMLLPIAGPIIVLVQCCKDSQGENQWGPSPKY